MAVLTKAWARQPNSYVSGISHFRLGQIHSLKQTSADYLHVICTPPRTHAHTTRVAPANRFPQGLGKLWSAWAATLEDVRLLDLSVAELDPHATLPALGACGALTSLRLLLREPMAPDLACVDVGALPPRLEQLALRHVVVTAGKGTEDR